MATDPGSLVVQPLRHVALILDGNRRWASERGLSVDDGHRIGRDKVFDVLGWCEDAGIDVVTLWVLAVKNLRRSCAELDGLYQIFEELAKGLTARQRWRIRALGFLDLLPMHVAKLFREAEVATQHLPGLQANIAIAYDGRLEIVHAIQRLAYQARRDALAGGSEAPAVTPGDVASLLFTHDQPDPDLVIRTSGEMRLSGFLIWQAAQSELYFCRKYWPDFAREDLHMALDDYAHRTRRLGL
ncbi:polyprenyl diphosphate synthase [Streptomyces sp. P1-3]|uniref:polyprenyl diphosphate synthase n=1 Tax=Streptomyces sp. P1-3 TaxID=3421658 RepID=UPI003D365629